MRADEGLVGERAVIMCAGSMFAQSRLRASDWSIVVCPGSGDRRLEDVEGPGDAATLGCMVGSRDVGLSTSGKVLAYTDLFFCSSSAVGVQSGGVTLWKQY